ncbi:MAG: phosphonate ABC transporter ATP-binding protein [Hyphomicrobiaceae bacterium]
MSDLLDARHLSKLYRDRAALDDVSISVASGEFVAVLGPSGSGKTTLFRCLTRLVEPDRGEIFLGGKPFHGLKGRALAAARRKIAVVFQQFNLVRRLTARENVLAGRLADAPLWRVLGRSFAETDLDRAAAALCAVGLGDHIDQRADTLSGGQQQRVAIARAIIQDARLILADEPVASLDPATADAILKLLHGLTRSHGIGVLCTLHQPDLAARYADRVIRMDAGRICVDGGSVPIALPVKKLLA